MAVNRGKEFEKQIKKDIQKAGAFCLRLPDPQAGYMGVRNPCDFIAYSYPHIYLLECKSIHGTSFPLSNLTKNQYEGMLEASKTNGVIAGVIIWFADKDRTIFVPVQNIKLMKENRIKSINPDKLPDYSFFELTGKKKRILFDYDMEYFFKEVQVKNGI